MRLLIAALAIALTVASAQAQMGPNGMPAGSGIGQQASRAAEAGQTAAKPKSDEKAYNAALRNLPDKQYDPWHGVR
jgi:hypothetical protein